MKEVVNFLITLSLFVLAIQFFVVEPRATMAQTDENASEEFFDRGNEEMEKEAQYLETNDENTSQDNRGEENSDREIRQREAEIEPLEEKKPEGQRIEDVRSRDIGEDNLPAEPPVNEFKIKL